MEQILHSADAIDADRLLQNRAWSLIPSGAMEPDLGKVPNLGDLADRIVVQPSRGQKRGVKQ